MTHPGGLDRPFKPLDPSLLLLNGLGQVLDLGTASGMSCDENNITNLSLAPLVRINHPGVRMDAQLQFLTLGIKF